MELYEVLYSIGEDEVSKFVESPDEPTLVTFLDGQSLGPYNYILRDADLEQASPEPEPANQLNRREDGLWVESTVDQVEFFDLNVEVAL